MRDHQSDQPLTRISHRNMGNYALPIDASPDSSNPREETTAPHPADDTDKAQGIATNLASDQPTHILIDAVAHRITETDAKDLGFGVITREGIACIDESVRDRVNVLSVSGSHDRLTVGSRLYRNDGKEAVLIVVES